MGKTSLEVWDSADDDLKLRAMVLSAAQRYSAWHYCYASVPLPLCAAEPRAVLWRDLYRARYCLGTERRAPVPRAAPRFRARYSYPFN